MSDHIEANKKDDETDYIVNLLFQVFCNERYGKYSEQMDPGMEPSILESNIWIPVPSFRFEGSLSFLINAVFRSRQHPGIAIKKSNFQMYHPKKCARQQDGFKLSN